jgi:hypothetical protein
MGGQGGLPAHFPSPQGGSETHQPQNLPNPKNLLSIPSRRVGDSAAMSLGSSKVCFPSPQGGSETKVAYSDGSIGVYFPSPQGGSETMEQVRKLVADADAFHPLKAGRRPRCWR